MVVQHPVSGTQMTVLGPFHRLWAFLFGCIYYAVKGAWGWAVISFLTANGVFVILPLWNRSIIRSHYQRAGWQILEE